MYKRILVPLDGSPMGDRVLPYVRNLGKKLNAKVELFRVFDPEPAFFYPEPFEFQDRHEASEHYRQDVMTAMGTAKTDLESAGVAATAVLHGPEKAETEGKKMSHTFGTAAEHIVLESEKDDDTLIVMSTHGRSGAGRWVMGSVTDKVLHAVKTPLMIIRAEGNDAVLDGTMGHIIVPLDGSALAETILPHGDPATAIVDLAHEFPDALVAMTTHGRSGMGRWWMGSVADRVVRHAAGPVMVLRG